MSDNHTRYDLRRSVSRLRPINDEGDGATTEQCFFVGGAARHGTGVRKLLDD